MVQFPVKLRRNVVHPSLFVPKEDVGVEAVVVLQAVGFGTARVVLLVAPDAEGADAEPHPGFGAAYGVVKLFYEHVHVVAAPVTPVLPFAELGVACGVGVEGRFAGIGIEIVVYVNGVYLISAHDVAHHVADEVAVFLIRGVEKYFAVIFEEAVRLLFRDMVGGKRGRRHGDAVGVNPRVELHAAFVGFLDGELHGVPHRRGSFAAEPGEVLRPVFEVALVKGVGHGTHLENHGIAAGFFEGIELFYNELLGLVGGHPGVVHRADDMKPGTAELAFRSRINIFGGYAPRQGSGCHQKCHQ